MAARNSPLNPDGGNCAVRRCSWHNLLDLGNYVRTYVRTYEQTYVRTYVHTYVRREHARTYVARKRLQGTYARTYVRPYVRTTLAESAAKT